MVACRSGDMLERQAHVCGDVPEQWSGRRRNAESTTVSARETRARSWRFGGRHRFARVGKSLSMLASNSR